MLNIIIKNNIFLFLMGIFFFFYENRYIVYRYVRFLFLILMVGVFSPMFSRLLENAICIPHASLTYGNLVLIKITLIMLIMVQ